MGEDDQQPVSAAARAWQGLDVGAAVSVGFAGVFIFVGLLVSAGLERAARVVVPYAALIIGLAVVHPGLAVFEGHTAAFGYLAMGLVVAGAVLGWMRGRGG